MSIFEKRKMRKKENQNPTSKNRFYQENNSEAENEVRKVEQRNKKRRTKNCNEQAKNISGSFS